MTRQCVGKKEGEDWSGLEERDIYPFLKAFVKTDYILATGVWKRLLQVFYPEKLSLSVNQNAISVVFHTPVTESVKADTGEVSPDSSGVSVLCMLRPIYICKCMCKCDLWHLEVNVLSYEYHSCKFCCLASETAVATIAVLKGVILACQTDCLWQRILHMNSSYKTT